MGTEKEEASWERRLGKMNSLQVVPTERSGKLFVWPKLELRRAGWEVGIVKWPTHEQLKSGSAGVDSGKVHEEPSWVNRNQHAAAKSLQSCPTLCDPIDGSPPGFPVPGILQARTLEWVAISFSNTWKWKVKVKLLSHVRPSATQSTAAFQAPPSMGFSRQEYWGGVPLPSPRNQHRGLKCSAQNLEENQEQRHPGKQEKKVCQEMEWLVVSQT